MERQLESVAALKIIIIDGYFGRIHTTGRRNRRVYSVFNSSFRENKKDKKNLTIRTRAKKEIKL